jgi:hypothetical protein
MGKSTFEHVGFIGASFSFCAMCLYYVWLVELEIWRSVVEDDNCFTDGRFVNSEEKGVAMQDLSGKGMEVGGYQGTGAAAGLEERSILTEQAPE